MCQPGQDYGDGDFRLVVMALIAFVLFVLSCGCDRARAPMAPVTAPSSISSQTLIAHSAAACAPAGPTALSVWTQGQVVHFDWQRDSSPDHQIQIERRNNAGAHEAAGAFLVNGYQVSVEWSAKAEGTYRARIRSRDCGEAYGAWSPFIEFGVEFEPNNGNAGGAGPDGIPAGSSPGVNGGGPMAGGAGGDLPGGSGHGGDQRCPNGASGDHNQDGHEDCGLGRDK